MLSTDDYELPTLDLDHSVAEIPALQQSDNLSPEICNDEKLYSNSNVNSTLGNTTCLADVFLRICDTHQLQQLKQGDIAVYIPEGDTQHCRPVCIMSNPNEINNRVDIYDGDEHLNVFLEDLRLSVFCETCIGEEDILKILHKHNFNSQRAFDEVKAELDSNRYLHSIPDQPRLWNQTMFKNVCDEMEKEYTLSRQSVTTPIKSILHKSYLLSSSYQYCSSTTPEGLIWEKKSSNQGVFMFYLIFGKNSDDFSDISDSTLSQILNSRYQLFLRARRVFSTSISLTEAGMEIEEDHSNGNYVNPDNFPIVINKDSARTVLKQSVQEFRVSGTLGKLGITVHFVPSTDCNSVKAFVATVSETSENQIEVGDEIISMNKIVVASTPWSQLLTEVSKFYRTSVFVTFELKRIVVIQSCESPQQEITHATDQTNTIVEECESPDITPVNTVINIVTPETVPKPIVQTVPKPIAVPKPISDIKISSPQQPVTKSTKRKSVTSYPSKSKVVKPSYFPMTTEVHGVRAMSAKELIAWRLKFRIGCALFARQSPTSREEYVASLVRFVLYRPSDTMNTEGGIHEIDYSELEKHTVALLKTKIEAGEEEAEFAVSVENSSYVREDVFVELKWDTGYKDIIPFIPVYVRLCIDDNNEIASPTGGRRSSRSRK